MHYDIGIILKTALIVTKTVTIKKPTICKSNNWLLYSTQGGNRTHTSEETGF